MSQKNMGRLAQDMKRELIAIIGRLKDPRLEGGLYILGGQMPAAAVF